MTRHSGRPSGGVRPLDPTGFSFHGFGPRTRRVEQNVRKVGIRSNDPEVSVVEGAVFVPRANPQLASQVSAQPPIGGGIVAPDGQPIDAAHIHHRGRLVAGLVGPIAVVPERELDEEVVYLGWLTNHFGNVLLESLARIWFLREVNPSVRVVFHKPGWPLGGWVLRILELFGVPPDRILFLDAPTRVRRVFVPEPLFEQRDAAHEGMIRPFREAASGIAGDAKPSEQPVYLSRRLLSSRQRPIVGEGELEDVLRENGFRIAHPQRMTIEDQVRLVNEHMDIFSSVGSAAHNILFALGKPTLHLLTNDTLIHLNYFLCSAIAGVPTIFVNYLGTESRPTFNDDGPQATPQLVETPKLIEYLDVRGLLTKRPALPAGRGPALRDRYDEAWLYAQVRSAAGQHETLPPEVEREALSLAARSWPVSAVLALYYADVQRDASRADGMVERFAKLAAAEADRDRLEHYRTEIRRMAAIVARTCDAETAGRLTAVVSDRFLAEPQDTSEGP